MYKFKPQDTVLLTGWLFADLLLGLMVVFMASIPVIPDNSVLKLTVTPSDLGTKDCKGQNDVYSCTVTLSATADSSGKIEWFAQDNNIGKKVTFTPAKGDLKPGGSIKIVIENIPCHDGGFTFTGLNNVKPASVFWNCTQELTLDRKPTSYTWSISNPAALISNASDSGTVNEIRQQIQKDIVPERRRVGLVIVYGGAPTNDDTNQAEDISDKVAAIIIASEKDIPVLKNARSYSGFHQLGEKITYLKVAVFYFNRS